MGNSHLNKARNLKNDEFYTRYEDIEKYFSQFNYSGMSIYCPCDDYRTSNFVKWFKDNFNRLGITHLTATCHIPNGHGLRYDYDGSGETVGELNGDGDFMSEECTAIKDSTDCIVTNPPFSMINKCFHQWVHNRKYVYVSNVCACYHSNVFGDVYEGKMFVYRGMGKFIKPNDESLVGVTAHIHTNIPTTATIEYHQPNRKYDPSIHLKYDNYDAINCDSYKDIPCDYYGRIGVPVSYILKLDRRLFDIVGVLNGWGKSNIPWKLYCGGCLPRLNGQNKFSRLVIQRKDNNTEVID